MSLNYTPIFVSRQHFGDEQNVFGLVHADWVKREHTYPFDCPNVDPNQWAVLMFQSYDVNFDGNVFKINNAQVPGGLPVGPKHETVGNTVHSSWIGNVMLVEPNLLKPTGNTLHVEAKGHSGVDDFILDNMVILYKTAGPFV